MLIQFVELLILVIFASLMQSNFKIPSPITFMSSILILKAININLFNVDNSSFDALVLITLPILIATDVLKLQWKDLKENWFSLFWVSVITVLSSILAGVFLNHYVITDYNLSVPAVIILFSAIVATDPVTVSAIFSNFKVPHRLKVLTEGESLFNDAVTLIVFSIALTAISTPKEINIYFITFQTLKVMVGAFLVGFLIGKLTTFLLKLSEDPLIEGSMIVLSAYTSYLIAEHFHFSGILSIIVSIVLVNKTIQDLLSKDGNEVNAAQSIGSFSLLKFSMTTFNNHQIILKTVDFIALFAAGTLFISIASIVNFQNLILHWKEITSVFIASTVIRGLMMLKFAFISNQYSNMQSISKSWWSVLTFAGSKGALSILMIHMIPNSFVFKPLFETIIIGNILLSTFIYSIILAIVIVRNKTKFEQELLLETH